ncbi:MAG: response regulator transcription factor [Deltaproteobacteria bacterium]|nr:response regulator transcription factor [Deltaproteobacteria bacterium]MCW5807780.1 response regulator transcription factor [Deltaproteobacteria bacterium]
MKILLVEDDERMAGLVRRGLVEEGHQVDVCRRGADAAAQATSVRYDVVLLDWGLPDVDGVSVLRRWRERGMTIPVLMLTARGSVGERVTGLRAGADDYLTKPFDFDELLARLEALRRRAAGGLPSLGALHVDERRRALVLGDREETLTAREWQLWLAFLEHRGDVLTRSELLGRVWGPDFTGEPNVVDVYVGYLRAKLASIGAAHVAIRAVRGVGFRLEVAAA